MAGFSSAIKIDNKVTPSTHTASEVISKNQEANAQNKTDNEKISNDNNNEKNDVTKNNIQDTDDNMSRRPPVPTPRKNIRKEAYDTKEEHTIQDGKLSVIPESNEEDVQDSIDINIQENEAFIQKMEDIKNLINDIATNGNCSKTEDIKTKLPTPRKFLRKQPETADQKATKFAFDLALKELNKGNTELKSLLTRLRKSDTNKKVLVEKMLLGDNTDDMIAQKIRDFCATADILLLKECEDIEEIWSNYSACVEVLKEASQKAELNIDKLNSLKMQERKFIQAFNQATVELIAKSVIDIGPEITSKQQKLNQLKLQSEIVKQEPRYHQMQEKAKKHEDTFTELAKTMPSLVSQKSKESKELSTENKVDPDKNKSIKMRKIL